MASALPWSAAYNNKHHQSAIDQQQEKNGGTTTTHPRIPPPRNLDILRPTHTHLRIIPQRKLRARQPLLRRLLRERKREPLILLEAPLRAAQEPLTERHIRLDLALLAREAVVLHAQERVERERGLRELVRVPELVLRGGEAEVGGALEVLARFEGGGGGGGDEGLEEVFGDGDVGEFGEEEEGVDVGGLGDVGGGEGGCAVKEGGGDS